MTIQPIPEAQPPAQVAADLRALADLAERDPYLSAVIERFFHTAVWPTHASYWRTAPREVAFEHAVTALSELAEGDPQRREDGGIVRVDILMRAIMLRLMDATPEGIAAMEKEVGW